MPWQRAPVQRWFAVEAVFLLAVCAIIIWTTCRVLNVLAAMYPGH